MGIKIDKIIRSRRKTISLEVTPDASLIVRAPLFLPKSAIQKAADSKAAWVTKKRLQMTDRNQKYPPKSYVSGEIFWFLGSSYSLAFSAEIKEPVMKGGALTLPQNHRLGAEALCTRWYKAQALRVIAPRVDLFSHSNGLQFKSVGITSAKKRWGSCGGDNSLNFSWRLVMAPLNVIDYVVVHELAHTQFHNHSKAFWAKVYEIMPDYETQKQWLADNGGLLNEKHL